MVESSKNENEKLLQYKLEKQYQLTATGLQILYVCAILLLLISIAIPVWMFSIVGFDNLNPEFFQSLGFTFVVYTIVSIGFVMLVGYCYCLSIPDKKPRIWIQIVILCQVLAAIVGYGGPWIFDLVLGINAPSEAANVRFVCALLSQIIGASSTYFFIIFCMALTDCFQPSMALARIAQVQSILFFIVMGCLILLWVSMHGLATAKNPTNDAAVAILILVGLTVVSSVTFGIRQILMIREARSLILSGRRVKSGYEPKVAETENVNFPDGRVELSKLAPEKLNPALVSQLGQPVMPVIFHDLPISAPCENVFLAVSSGAGLSSWWTKSCYGSPELGATYELDFGPGYLWKANVTKFEVNRSFELTFVEAEDDWMQTVVGFELEPTSNGTHLRFVHRGWKEVNDHFRTSTYCWAMYLRVMKRCIEFGENVEYERRLDV